MTHCLRLETRDRLIAHYNGLCAYCLTRPAAVMDHVVPRSRGGSHGSTNRLPACLECDGAKGSMTVAEWVAGGAKDALGPDIPTATAA